MPRRKKSEIEAEKKRIAEEAERIKAEEAAAEKEAAEEEVMQITINDLKTSVDIIDIAATRGAFRAGEMAVVGAVYNKLKKFVEANTASTEEESTTGGVE